MPPNRSGRTASAGAGQIGVPEVHVDMQRNLRGRQLCGHSDSHTVVVGFITDLLSADGVEIELEPVIAENGKDADDASFNLGDIVGEPSSREVDIPGWSPISKGRHEHATFENEVCGRFGRGKSG
nr:hypothetical protein GCM10023233_05820 [Brevibacterium otitidis]